MIRIKAKDADGRLRLASYVILIVTLILFLGKTVELLTAERTTDSFNLGNALKGTISGGALLFATGFGAIVLVGIRVNNRYRLAMALVLALTAVRALGLGTSQLWDSSLGQRSHATPFSILWNAADLGCLSIFYLGMKWLCEESELRWARARWQTVQCLLLCALCAFLVDTFLNTRNVTAGRNLAEQTIQAIGMSAYVLAALAFVSGIVAIRRTAGDLRAKKLVFSKSSASDSIYPEPSAAWFKPADEALLLVLVGNNLWSIALPLHSSWLFYAGAAVTVLGFFLKGTEGVLYGTEILSKTSGLELVWRPAVTLAALFVLVFIVNFIRL